MTKQKKQAIEKPDYIVEASIILLTVIVLTSSLVWYRLDITVTLVFLFGVWVLDGMIKKSYNLGIKTIFADFSFAAFVFVSSRSVSIVSNMSSMSVHTNSLPQIFVVVFILLILWLGNLLVCRGFANGTTKSQPGVWFISIVFALLSACGALIPQTLGLL